MATQTRGQSISIEDADINIGFSQVESKDDMGGQKILRILAKNAQSIYNDIREIELLETLDDIEWDILLMSETWRKTKQEIWKTERGHLFLGSGWDAGHKGVAILIHRRHTKTFKGFMPESERICAVDLDSFGK